MRRVLVAVVGLAVAATNAACSTADLSTPPDASTSDACVAGPVVFCDAEPPGAPGCVGDPDASNPNARGFPADAAFANGCQANVVGDYVGPSGTCHFVTSCSCVATAADGGADAATFAWQCGM